MERERRFVTAFLVLQLVLWLGFFIHRSPRFPGSLSGGVLGVVAAVLMLVPLAYPLVKRITWLKQNISTRWPLPRVLAWHVYASVLGALFGILHTGHRFESWLGILLTGTMLLSVFTGYVGRHFLRYVALDLKERQANLTSLQVAYAAIAQQGSGQQVKTMPTTLVSKLRLQLAALLAGPARTSELVDPHIQSLQLTDAIADLEYAISADELIKLRLRRWLIVHIAMSIAFYVLLVLHVVAGIQYGLRWFV